MYQNYKYNSMKKDYNEFVQHMVDTMPLLEIAPLEHALTLERIKDGIVLELGVYSARSIRKMAVAMPTQTIYGFDSFEGLPEDWGRPDMKFAKGAFSLKKRLPAVPSNVQLIAGWFDTTLPQFASEHKGEVISFLHVDCDLYSSTKCAFDILGGMLRVGSIIVFDELLNYPTYEKHEIKAFYEWLKTTNYDVEWLGKIGPIDLEPKKDNGYVDQPVACRLISE